MARDWDYILISRTKQEFFSNDEYESGEEEFCSTVHAYMKRGYKVTGGIEEFDGKIYQAMYKENI